MITRRLQVLCCRKLSRAAAHARAEYRPVIGLEVHVQLKTRSKLFSRAPAGEEAGPNSRVVSFDMATPGTLPTLNRAAVMHALRMAELMNCEVPARCSFDRKHYFYADMPAGYQITQSSSPIARNGLFGFHVFGEQIATYWKEVGILQLQLEQDSGKTIHHGDVSLIDLNRAGAALIEVVTSPSFSTALEAVCFVQQLRLMLIHYAICDGEMHKGQLRVDANVSLSKDDKLGVRTEVKNMNSLRHLHTAVNYEIDRQYGILSGGGIVVNETRGIDAQGRTVSMRDKEEETDYRIMREPNLPNLAIKSDWMNSCQQDVRSSLPLYQKFISQGFDPRTAIHFAEDPLLCRFVTNCSPQLEDVSIDGFVDWLRDLKMIMQRSKATFPPQSPFFAQQFVKLVSFVEKRRITRLRAIEELRSYVNELEIRPIEQVLTEDDLWSIDDLGTIDGLIQDVFEKNKSVVAKAKEGNAKAVTKLRKLAVDSSGKRIEIDVIDSRIKTLLID